MSKRRSTAAAAEPQDNGVIPSTIPTAIDAPAGASEARFMPAVPLDDIVESPLNPRKRFDDMQELTESIRQKGVLTPVLVRPVPGWNVTPDMGGRHYELAAGHRRLRAARAAGVAAIPAMAREMDDAELLELLVVDNNQRKDVHPLEEAQGYQALLGLKSYDVARIAARVGRSVKYVYDRIKLLDLVPQAQKLFLEDRFTAGHAILLARLQPKDQERAIAVGDEVYHRPALFTDERGLYDEDYDAKDPYAGVKAVSVREFERWIQDQVKFDAAQADPMLFPETAEELERAEIAKLKVIPITRDYMASDAVRKAANGERIYGEQAWKRADGKAGSKACESKRVGLVACGPNQGQAFRVCVDKEKCAIHWGGWQKERRAPEGRRPRRLWKRRPERRGSQDEAAAGEGRPGARVRR